MLGPHKIEGSITYDTVCRAECTTDNGAAQASPFKPPQANYHEYIYSFKRWKAMRQESKDGPDRKWMEGNSIKTGFDLVLDAEQKYVGMAVDMALAERTEIFVRNGFSSLTENILMHRTIIDWGVWAELDIPLLM
ncbi:hypothetical protein BD779DRAFT_220522 [Infundibulicybe gibba]|nr:hypothetical protein BD779DRAFT_220522 [Infundibulicybe gibba]